MNSCHQGGLLLELVSWDGCVSASICVTGCFFFGSISMWREVIPPNSVEGIKQYIIAKITVLACIYKICYWHLCRQTF